MNTHTHRRSYRARNTATLVTVAAACLAAAVSAGDVHDVTQVGLTFDPPDVVVAAGDTIRWTHTSGIHTVTSGSDCLFDGVFDEPLDFDNTIVELVVPDVEGVIDYFCRPHCSFDMVGTITVVASGDPCPEDLDETGDVGLGDLLLVLAAWGPCKGECPRDLDESGAVDFGDVLRILGAWGPCPG